MTDMAAADTGAQAGGLKLATKLGYGAGDVSAAIVTQVTGFFLTAFLLDVALLRPGIIAVIVLVSNLWDAVTDPFVGNLSDRTRTRWGRRRPWLLFGAVPFGIVFLLQWVVPPFGDAGLFVYYLLMAILLKTAFTVVNVPYTALTPEIAQGYDERTSLTSFRFAFSIAGGLAAVIGFQTLVGALGETATSYVITGGLLGLFVVASPLVTFSFTQEDPAYSEDGEASVGFVKGLQLAFTNRPFLYVVGIYLCCWLVVQFVQANLLLYMRYWVGDDGLFTPFVFILQVTSFSFLPVWAWVSARYGKRIAYFIGAGMFIVVAVGIYLIPQDVSQLMLYTMAFLGGVCVSMALLLPWSMLPDVVDYDELQTGQRREGVYYGLFVFIQKIGLSLALGASALLLGIAGYINPVPVVTTAPTSLVAEPDAGAAVVGELEPGAQFLADLVTTDGAYVRVRGEAGVGWLPVAALEAPRDPISVLPEGSSQPDGVLNVLRLSVSLFPVLLLILSLPLAYFYPITRTTFNEMRQQLQKREAAAG
jgi:GPH family glycoside/pentoside/hexuronide:cation symporter